jgi:hypothetical protein
MRHVEPLGISVNLAIFSSSANAFVEAVKQNMVLKQAEFCNLDKRKYSYQGSHAMSESSFGSELRWSQDPQIVKCSTFLWPQILARSANDPNVLFFSLQEKSDIFVERTHLWYL